MGMNITVDLLEGMKIALKNELENEYTLIKSNKDNEMYGIYVSHVIKLSDLDNLGKDYICTNVSCFTDERKVIETQNKNYYAVDNDFSIDDFIDNEIFCKNEFEDVGIKITNMTKEEYMKKIGRNFYFNCRDIIAESYDNQRKRLKTPKTVKE